MIALQKGTGEIMERRFHDLRVDPGEVGRSEWPVRGGPSEELLSLCRSDVDPGGLRKRYAEGVQLTAPKVSPRATEEELERLRSLGYVN